MPLYSQQVYPDPLNVIFFDDFLDSVYNSRVWSVTGTGSVAIQNAVGGTILITGNATYAYRFNLGNIGAFSVANLAKVQWNGHLNPAAAGTASTGYSECGLQSSTNPTTSFMSWRKQLGTTNWLCITNSGGTATTTNSGVASDTNTHDFRIECYSGNVLFYLDGVLVKTNTTNITADLLQPFVNCQGSTGTGAAASTATIGFVQAWGVR